jgi:hypothetical protein
LRITSSGSRPSAKGPSEWFTGIVRIDPLFAANAPARAAGNAVTFEPGARTAWHTLSTVNSSPIATVVEQFVRHPRLAASATQGDAALAPFSSATTSPRIASQIDPGVLDLPAVFPGTLPGPSTDRIGARHDKLAN